MLIEVLRIPELRTRLLALARIRGGVTELRKDVPHVVTFCGEPTLELAADILAALALGGDHLGLELGDKASELGDREVCKVTVTAPRKTDRADTPKESHSGTDTASSERNRSTAQK